MTIKTTTHLTPDRACTLRLSSFVYGLAARLPWLLCIALALVVGLLLGRRGQPAPLQSVIAPPPIILIATPQPTLPLPTPQPAVALDQARPTPSVAPAATTAPEPETAYQVADVQPTSAPTDAPIVGEVRTAVAANPQATVQIVKDANPCQSDDPVVRASCEVFK